MFSPDQDYSDAPYRLLIRARTQAELERAIIIVATHIAATAGSKHVSEKLAPVAAKTASSIVLSQSLGRSHKAINSGDVVSALKLVTDFDDWCGTPWHWPWPWPGPDPGPDPRPWRESGLFDVAVLEAVKGLAQLVPDVAADLLGTSDALLKEFRDQTGLGNLTKAEESA